MPDNRKSTRTEKALSRTVALGALVYLIVTFVVYGTESAGEVASVIAGISLLLTSLGLIQFRADASSRRPARKAAATEAAKGRRNDADPIQCADAVHAHDEPTAAKGERRSRPVDPAATGPIGRS
jgi:hypothetical protein